MTWTREQWQDFFHKVAAMRARQRAWFKDKRPSDLQASKDLERRVDRLIAERKDSQGMLFEQ